jgi:hypothetical protein
LAYHAGALVDGHFFMFGGQNLQLKQINTVYYYDIEENKMNKFSPKVNKLNYIYNAKIKYFLLNLPILFYTHDFNFKRI